MNLFRAATIYRSIKIGYIERYEIFAIREKGFI
jgi:hypothetical protein